MKTRTQSILIPVTFGAFSLALTAFSIQQRPDLVWEFEIPVIATKNDTPYFETVFDYSLQDGQAHAPAIIVEPNGFSLIWFQGTKEAHSDIAIYHSRFGEGGHSEPKPLLTSPEISAATIPLQNVTTLGNTIQYGLQTDRFFSTIVSIGGWAMASIADVKMLDGQVVSARKLSLSPFLNRSHLVKNPPVTFIDGDIGLPAYFELGNAFSELIRIGENGRVLDKRRISQGHVGIQPAIVPLDATTAVAFLRDFNNTGLLQAAWTFDGGQSWTETTALDIPNPDAPVAALLLNDGRILMVFNDSDTRADLLRLAISSDQGLTWNRIATLEDLKGARRSDTRYPMLRRLSDGNIALVYSHSSKRGIRAHVFNDAWVDAQ